MTDKKNNVGTYFKSLKLENVRCFEDACLDLTDENGNIAQWTLLLGDNGVGKTTLLQCLCWMRPAFEENEESASAEENNDENVESTADFLEPITKGRLKSFLQGENNDVLVLCYRKGCSDDLFCVISNDAKKQTNHSINRTRLSFFDKHSIER